MNVLNILKLTCAYLGFFDDFKTFFELTPETLPPEKERELEILLLSVDNVQNRLLNSFPQITKENVEAQDNKIMLNSLTKTAKKVLSVKENGNNIKFKIYDNFILTNKNGTFEVEYSYLLPKVLTKTDEIALNFLPERTFALGVASEYCFISGLFDDAVIWEEKFKSVLKKESEAVRTFIMPKRKWR